METFTTYTIENNPCRCIARTMFGLFLVTIGLVAFI